MNDTRTKRGRKPFSEWPKYIQTLVNRLEKDLEAMTKSRNEWRNHAHRNLPGPPVAGVYRGNGFVIDLSKVVEIRWTVKDNEYTTTVNTDGGHTLSYTGSDNSIAEYYLSWKQSQGRR